MTTSEKAEMTTSDEPSSTSVAAQMPTSGDEQMQTPSLTRADLQDVDREALITLCLGLSKINDALTTAYEGVTTTLDAAWREVEAVAEVEL